MELTLELEAIMGVVLLLVFVWGLVRVINDPENPIEWWHFFSSRGADGKQYGDANKLGICVGIVFSTLFIGWYAYMLSLGWELFGLWLLFIAGVEGFGKWFRGFLDKKFTGGQTLPTPEPTKKEDKKDKPEKPE